MDSTLSTFIASDGDHIAIQDWPLDSALALRGVVIVLHGLGEHAGRYARLAKQLNHWGFAVRGYDQCGHGESGGKRGALPVPGRLLDDLADVVESTMLHMPSETPLILLGQGMGAVVAAQFAQLQVRRVDALVLCSPAFDPALGWLRRRLIRTLAAMASRLTFTSGVRARHISRKEAVVRAYAGDPLVHKRLTAALGSFLLDAGRACVRAAPQWRVATLLLFAGKDRIVNSAASREFAKRAPAQVVRAVCFEAMYHEIWNEPDAYLACTELKLWLDQRF